VSFPTYRIRFKEFVPPLEISVADSHPLLQVPAFSVEADQEPSRDVVFEPNRAACLVFQRNRLSLDAEIEKLKSLLLAGAVPQIEMLLRGTGLPEPRSNMVTAVISLGHSEAQQLVEHSGQKTCNYQTNDGRDLLCSAASENDLMKIALIGTRYVAPTSVAICNQCDIPDETSRCSHFSHPAVAREQGGHERRVKRAFCDLGSSKISQPSKCKPGGHDCWTRIVEPQKGAPAPIYVSPALTVALDYLDAIWRLHFGKDKRLISLRSAVSTARLEGICRSRDELDACLSSFADSLKQFQIPDELIPDPEIRSGDGTLMKLKNALSVLGPNVDESDQIETAIDALKMINSLRVATQHSQTRINPANSFKMLGISYPPADWSDTWNQLRSKATIALTTIATQILKHT